MVSAKEVSTGLDLVMAKDKVMVVADMGQELMAVSKTFLLFLFLNDVRKINFYNRIYH